MDPEGLAVNHIALDKEDEAIKRFVLSLPVGASGAVLELEGRALACVVPIVAEPVPANGAWSEAKNARRCELIDKEIDGTLSAEKPWSCICCTRDVGPSPQGRSVAVGRAR